MLTTCYSDVGVKIAEKEGTSGGIVTSGMTEI
jgi:hypothetical protein